ncbi:DoxX-like family protein [Puia sp.]|jgi:hypothetical protein|uniref:DoxX-like family protein n=1 Tax=Puia sp. TaxID=2045100 RepID=UPI002F3EE536
MHPGSIPLLTWLIAGIWIINGLYCKLLNRVPRHRLIVARIAGASFAGSLTKLIGVAELLMAVWILSGIETRLAAITQVMVIAAMNSIEFFMAPDLLLFGRGNAILAGVLVVWAYVTVVFFVVAMRMRGK